LCFGLLKISERKQSGHLCLEESTYIVEGKREAGRWEEQNGMNCHIKYQLALDRETGEF
jgi:hypothetical protein